MTKARLYYLFFFLFALYLLTYAPTLHSSDGLAMFSTAESLARRGAWDIEQIRWMGLQQGTYGLDGLLYSRKGIGQPLLALPLTWLGVHLPWFGPVTMTVLFGSLITALTGVLIFVTLTRLGYSEQTGLLAALVYGTGTLAWPYAKTFFSDPLAGFLLLAATLTLLCFGQTYQKRYAFLAGLSLAWAVATRYAEGIFLPVFGLLFLAYLNPKSHLAKTTAGDPVPNLKSLILPILAFGLPIAIAGMGLMAFNIARYGNPLNTGYLPEETFSAIWWQGILGQLISPGRGLFLYSPILLVSFFGLKTFWQLHRLEALASLAVILIHLLLYGKWFMWHGGFAWGPRFMVPTLPFWVLLMAPVLDRLRTRPNWRFGFYSLWAISIVGQIPGLAVDFELWQNHLLQTGLPLFAPVTFFAPVYSPLLGTWSFISLANLDVAWVTEGKIIWPLLALLLINLIAATWVLIQDQSQWFQFSRREAGPRVEDASRRSEGRRSDRAERSRFVLTTLTIVTSIFLLGQAHQTQADDLRAIMDQINSTQFPLIYHNPEQAIPLAELYQGHAPVLGLLTLDTNHLDAFTAQAPALWWLSSYQNEIETHLLTGYGIARMETYGEQRLISFARPDGPPQPINVQFEGAITLQDVRLSTSFQPNAPFAVEFTWQASQTPVEDYHIFIHLTDATGQTVTQTDSQPVHWTRPTTTWLANETLIDPHALWLPNLPPGTYTLITGLYRPTTGERLLTKTGNQFVVLGSFSVAP
jgi:hypothetical protein